MFTILPHAFVFEIFQLVLAVISTWYAVADFMECRKDTQALRESGINGSSMHIAGRSENDAQYRILTGFVLVCAGVLSVAFAPPGPFLFRGESNPLMISVMVGEMAVFSVTILLLLKVVQHARVRAAVKRVKAQNPQDRRRGGDRRHDTHRS